MADPNLDPTLRALEERCMPFRIQWLVAMEAARAAEDDRGVAHYTPLTERATDADRAEADDICRAVLALAYDRGLDYPALLRDVAAMGSQYAAAQDCAAFHATRDAGDRTGIRLDD